MTGCSVPASGTARSVMTPLRSSPFVVGIRPLPAGVSALASPQDHGEKGY